MGIVGPETPREALGRMMAGEPAESVLPAAPWDHSDVASSQQADGAHVPDDAHAAADDALSLIHI